jgi:hypothetical protein
MEAAICGEHKSRIDQGARWLYQPAEVSEGALLMGRDLPPRAVDVSAKELISPDGHTWRFTFMVEKPDGSQREQDLEMAPDVAEGVWRALGIDREAAGPASAPGEAARE